MSTAAGHPAEAGDPPQRGIVPDGDCAHLEGDDGIGKTAKALGLTLPPCSPAPTR